MSMNINGGNNDNCGKKNGKCRKKVLITDSYGGKLETANLTLKLAFTT